MSEEQNQGGFSAKDLFVPIAIVVAGIFVGGGLYLGGMPGAPKAPSAPTDPLLALAIEAGVDEDDFQSCLDNKETAALVEEDAANAAATGGNGTPWGILIGPGGKKYPIAGALPLAAVEQIIEVAKSGDDPEAENIELLEYMNPVTADDHIKGDLDAEIIIVEYSDFDCPFCARFHGTMNSLVAKYPPNEVAWVYRHLPLDQLHPNARKVAMASECVAKLGGNDAFWVFADGYAR